ncbi:hypothetical protein K501DRAFT_47978 [Backusella circina FSU 941]|nr:hypothetical protein K501DRAFT_47978 [Backusella circina FSU 941]
MTNITHVVELDIILIVKSNTLCRFICLLLHFIIYCVILFVYFCSSYVFCKYNIRTNC